MADASEAITIGRHGKRRESIFTVQHIDENRDGRQPFMRYGMLAQQVIVRNQANPGLLLCEITLMKPLFSKTHETGLN